MAYRLRLFSLDGWNLWGWLTRDHTWEGPDGERLDGTNNVCERAIGWWVKERYRSMRGDKRPLSVLHVSRLIAAMGNALDGPGFALAEIIVLPGLLWKVTAGHLSGRGTVLSPAQPRRGPHAAVCHTR